MKELLQKLGAQEWAAFAQSALHIVLILSLARFLLRLARRLIRLAREHMTNRVDDAEQAKRVATLMRMLRYAASVTIAIVATMLVLSEVGISIAPLLAAAGVARIAVGFGAQSLVKDHFTGIIMLIAVHARPR